MDNFFYILFDKNQVTDNPIKNSDFTIERLQICTWNLKDNSCSYIELGLEIQIQPQLNESFKNKDLKLVFVAPFLEKIKAIYCLNNNLISKDENAQYIFNETINKVDVKASTGTTVGSIISFVNNSDKKKLIISKNVDDITEEEKINEIQKNKYFEFTTLCNTVLKSQFQCNDMNIYIRYLFEINENIITSSIDGIGKRIFYYDIKLNYERNITKIAKDLIENHDYDYCKLNNAFCLHVFPNNYEISYIDSKESKVRILEKNAFIQYLKKDNSDKLYVPIDEEQDYNIIFMKKNNDYSFYVRLSKEIMTVGQLLISVFGGIGLTFIIYIDSFFGFDYKINIKRIISLTEYEINTKSLIANDLSSVWSFKYLWFCCVIFILSSLSIYTIKLFLNKESETTNQLKSSIIISVFITIILFGVRYLVLLL